MNPFAFQLFQFFSSTHKNVSLNPFSIAILINLLQEGTSGHLHTIFKQRLEEKASSKGFDKLLDTIKTGIKYGAFDFQNSIEHIEYLEIEKSYLKKIPPSFRPSIKLIDNASDYHFIISNEMALDLTWTFPHFLIPFKSGIFYLENGQESAAYYVHKQYVFGNNPIKYYQEERFQAISIPLADHNFTYEIILPNPSISLKQLKNELSLKQILALKDQFISLDRIEVILPKFDINSSISLANHKKALQIESLFENTFDFKPLFKSEEPLILKDIQFINKIIVNELGVQTQSKSVALGMIGSSPKIKAYPIFEANHPFLFILRENSSNTILQFGQFKQPDPILKEDRFFHSEHLYFQRKQVEKSRQIISQFSHFDFRELVYYGMELLNFILEKNHHQANELKRWGHDIVRFLTTDDLTEEMIKDLDFWPFTQLGYSYESNYFEEEACKQLLSTYPEIAPSLEAICHLLSGISYRHDFSPLNTKFRFLESIINESILYGFNLPLPSHQKEDGYDHTALGKKIDFEAIDWRILN